MEVVEAQHQHKHEELNVFDVSEFGPVFNGWPMRISEGLNSCWD